MGIGGAMCIWVRENQAGPPPPAGDEYVTEAGDPYVAEDGTTPYVPES